MFHNKTDRPGMVIPIQKRANWMLGSGKSLLQTPAYLKDSHWYMKILNFKDPLQVQRDINKVAPPQVPIEYLRFYIVRVVRGLFDLFPAANNFGLLTEYQKLLDRAIHVQQLDPVIFEKCMDHVMENLKSGVFVRNEDVTEYDEVTNPINILNQCYTIRYLKCSRLIHAVSMESIEEAERVYGRYDMVDFLERWSPDPDADPETTEAYEEFFLFYESETGVL